MKIQDYRRVCCLAVKAYLVSYSCDADNRPPAYVKITLLYHVPNASKHIAVVRDAKEGIGRGCCMEVSAFLVGKERVGHPDLFRHLSTDRH